MQYQSVAVLRGGPSEEYDLSLKTGANAVETLRSQGHRVKDIIISRKGEWLFEGYTQDPLNVLVDVDVVFVALHGAYVDDGEVLRILDRLHIPYTGSGPFASAVAFNKLLVKDHLKKAGVKVPQYFKITRDVMQNLPQTIHVISQTFGPSYIVKPVSSGSSLGVTFVSHSGILAEVIKNTLENYDTLLVEEYISGKNASVGVVEDFRNEKYYSLPPVEIIVPDEAGVLTYDLKFSEALQEVCPANFSKEEKNEMIEVAEKAHKELNLLQYSKSDFVVGKDGIYFLEINSRPALDNRSSFQTALTSVGASYSDLLEQLLVNAVSRK